MNQERYIRQTVLKEFGPEAQQKLLGAKVLVVGAGGLGIPVLTYLNAMGIGTLGIVDSDNISLTNLHRQVLYDEVDVGKSKVSVAVRKLKAQNSGTDIISHTKFLTKENALEMISDYDIVVDASDNFPTRYLVNDACVMLNKPFVYGALHGFEGQVSVFNFQGGPTYRCLFPNMPKPAEIPDCNEHGVLGVIPGIIGNLQALETVKVIAGIGEVLSGKLLLFNGLSNTFQNVKFSVKPENLEIASLRETYDFECADIVSSIDMEVFEQLLETQNIQIIDVRTPKEFNRGHLKIAKNIPLSELGKRLKEIAFDREAYFICQSGIRSRKAILQLKDYKPKANLINVSGGMNYLNAYVVE